MDKHKYNPHCQCLDCTKTHLQLVNAAHKAQAPKVHYHATVPATPRAKLATIRPPVNNAAQ